MKSERKAIDTDRNDKKQMIEEMTNALGAVSEMAGFLRDQLMNNGFKRGEAVIICSNFVNNMLNPNSSRREESD